MFIPKSNEKLLIESGGYKNKLNYDDYCVTVDSWTFFFELLDFSGFYKRFQAFTNLQIFSQFFEFSKFFKIFLFMEVYEVCNIQNESADICLIFLTNFRNLFTNSVFFKNFSKFSKTFFRNFRILQIFFESSDL